MLQAWLISIQLAYFDQLELIFTNARSKPADWFSRAYHQTGRFWYCVRGMIISSSAEVPAQTLKIVPIIEACFVPEWTSKIAVLQKKTRISWSRSAWSSEKDHVVSLLVTKRIKWFRLLSRKSCWRLSSIIFNKIVTTIWRLGLWH